MLSLSIAFTSVIGIFSPVFSRPVRQHVKVLLTGAVFAPGKRTVTAMLQIMGLSAASDVQTYHRVLNRSVWSPLTASRLLLRLVVAVFIPRGWSSSALMRPSNADAALRSKRKASTVIPCAPPTPMW